MPWTGPPSRIVVYSIDKYQGVKNFTRVTRWIRSPRVALHSNTRGRKIKTLNQ